MDKWRQNQYDVNIEDFANESSPWHQSDHDLLEREYWGVMMDKYMKNVTHYVYRLPYPQKECMLLYLENVRLRQIGEILGYSESSINKIFKKSIKRLRNMLFE